MRGGFHLSIKRGAMQAAMAVTVNFSGAGKALP